MVFQNTPLGTLVPELMGPVSPVWDLPPPRLFREPDSVAEKGRETLPQKLKGRFPTSQFSETDFFFLDKNTHSLTEAASASALPALFLS